MKIGRPSSPDYADIGANAVTVVEVGATHPMKVCPEDALTKKEPLGFRGFLAISAAFAVPHALALVVLSLMGTGMQVYSHSTGVEYNMHGNWCAFVAALWLCAAFIFDLHRHAVRRLLTIAVMFAWLLAAAILKCSDYPWAAPLFTMAIIPVALLEIRVSLCPNTPRTSFYKVVGLTAAFTTVALVVIWVVWVFRTDYTSTGAQWNEETKAQLIKDSRRIYANIYRKRPLDYVADCSGAMPPPPDAVLAKEIATACKLAHTVWFIIWVVPFGCIVFSFVILAFSVLVSRLDMDEHSKVLTILKWFICLVVSMVVGIWMSIYLAGASVQLASAFLAFFAGTMLALVVYTYTEVRPEVLKSVSQQGLGKYLRQAYNSDWMRAIGVGSVNVMIPILLGVDGLRQRARRCRGTALNPDDVLTEQGRMMVNELNTWNWCNIFVKVSLLDELFVTLILGGKFTFILFSWLNGVLAEVQFGIVIVLVLIVGVLMFMLPMVPGSAVYVFNGIVIGKQAQRNIGFWWGVVVASGVGLVGKLIACVGQYMIGYLAGKNVQVQKTIGVDKVPTRAIEKILNKKGWDIGKIAILVGGPDWPTSVTCGILKLNIPAMLIGTLPVYFCSIAPQTIVGALLTLDKTSNADLWNTIQSASTGVAALAQAAASLIAAYAITKTIETDYLELAEPRDEHKQVEELTRKEAAYTEAYGRVTKWDNLAPRRKILIFSAAVMHLVVGCVFAADFVLFEPICFRKFSISSDINAPFAETGLEGRVGNIIRLPVGAINLALFCFAFLLHMFHSKDLEHAARTMETE